jgi:hypothetical protein
VRRIVELRWRHRLSPLAIASRLSIPASTVHAVLVRCRLNRLSHIDIRTGEPIRHYEHSCPGALIHVDVKKLGNIPDGGGWRFVGRTQGFKNRRDTEGVKRSRSYDPKLGHAFVHTVIDDHSRVAYAEIHDDETAVTAIAVLHRAVGWFSGTWGHRRARVVRQRQLLQIARLAQRMRRAAHHAQTNATRHAGLTVSSPLQSASGAKVSSSFGTVAVGSGRLSASSARRSMNARSVALVAVRPSCMLSRLCW